MRSAVTRGGGLRALVAVMVTTVFGLQLLRVLFPLIGWYLRDTVGVSAFGLLPYAVVPAVAGLLAPVLARLVGARAATVAVVALAGVRVTEQFAASPAVDLWLAMVGLTLFIWALSLLATTRAGALAVGVLTGVALDAALRAAGRTLDLSWHDGIWAHAVVVLVAVGLIWAVAAEVPRGEARGPVRAAALVAVGPVLLLQEMVLANQGWVAEVTGWGWAASTALLLLAGALGVAATISRWVSTRGRALVGALLLIPVAVVATEAGSPVFMAALVGGHVGSGLLLGAAATPSDTPRSAWRTAGAITGGMLLLIAGAFVYYVSYDIDLGVEQPTVLVATALVAVLASLLAPAVRRPEPPGWALPAAGVVAVLGVVVPVGLVILAPLPTDSVEAGEELRVATYNVHSGYGTDGTQDLEALAATIERTGASVVGLQEVSRGWLLNGSTDLLGWLQRRLDMPHAAFVATTRDPLWGNAVLSRHPLREIRRGQLPILDTLIGRGWISADIELAGGERVQVISTHLHHTGDLERIHAVQVADLLEEAPDPTEPTVLLGDFNARPGTPQLEQILSGGFEDSWLDAGDGLGLTSNAADPEQRIDYLFHSPDLEARDAEVLVSQASDHFPVVTTVRGRG